MVDFHWPTTLDTETLLVTGRGLARARPYAKMIADADRTILATVVPISRRNKLGESSKMSLNCEHPLGTFLGHWRVSITMIYRLTSRLLKESQHSL
jgi:hypothetical protein